jgi:hypothetical protein
VLSVAPDWGGSGGAKKKAISSSSVTVPVYGSASPLGKTLAKTLKARGRWGHDDGQEC